MPDDIFINVRGLEGIEAKLLEVGEVHARKVVQAGLRAGGEVFRGAMVAAAPVKTGDGGLLAPGALKADIHMQVRGNRVLVGPGKATSFVARWVEFGHRMVSHTGKVFGHVQAHPFMRPSFDIAVEPAGQAFADAARAELATIKPAPKV